MAQVRIVDVINQFQNAKDQKTILETQLTTANQAVAETTPKIKAALEALPSKSTLLLTPSGKATVYIIDASKPEGFYSFDPDSSDTSVEIPDA